MNSGSKKMRYLFLFVLLPLVLVGACYIAVKVATHDRGQGYIFHVKKATEAVKELSTNLGYDQQQRKSYTIGVGMLPTPDFTFYKEVTFDVRGFVPDLKMKTEITQKIRDFCNSREGFRYGGGRKDRLSWKPKSVWKRQDVILCWVDLEVKGDKGTEDRGTYLGN